MRSIVGKHGDGEDRESGVFVDRISSLPDELLGHILSFLPTSCAVSTSVLSTRWRYLFTLTTCLSFSFDDAPYGYMDLLEKQESFKKFVYKVLELHQISPIRKFSLVCHDTCDGSDLCEWISSAVQKGVQELHYDIVEQYDVLPDSLFICQTLVRLTMLRNTNYEFTVPSSVWLPNLKILHLAHVFFADPDSMQNLFSGCKFLEELSLKYCGCDNGRRLIISSGLLKVLTIKDCFFEEDLFEIDAPNLTYLSYSSISNVKVIPSWKNSRSLVSTVLHFKNYADSDFNQYSLKYARGFFKDAASKVTELRLLSNSVELLLTLAEHEKMPDFPCLSRLHLGNFSYNTWKNVTKLLEKSPQLETVTFLWGFHRCNTDEVLPPIVVLPPFSCYAKEIEVHTLCDHECSPLLLGHLLRNARLLKRLIVEKYCCDNMKEQPQVEKIKELFMLSRASEDCCIEFKLIDYDYV